MQTQKLAVYFWSIASLVCTGSKPLQVTFECLSMGYLVLISSHVQWYIACEKEITFEGVKKESIIPPPEIPDGMPKCQIRV